MAERQLEGLMSGTLEKLRGMLGKKESADPAGETPQE